MGGLLLATAFALESATAAAAFGSGAAATALPFGPGLGACFVAGFAAGLGAWEAFAFAFAGTGVPDVLAASRVASRRCRRQRAFSSLPTRFASSRAASATCRSTRRICLRALPSALSFALSFASDIGPAAGVSAGAEAPVSGFTPAASGLACFDLRARRLAI